jgi:Domain of unknown function (DUF1772)
MLDPRLISVLGFLNIVFAGLLAGEEFLVCYGLRAPLGSLEGEVQIPTRQALIRRMRILVPMIFFAALASGVAVAMLGGTGLAFDLRCGAVGLLAVFILLTLTSTVPINKALLAWDAAAPPADWRALIARWERLDVARAWLALGAFALFLGASQLR